MLGEHSRKSILFNVEQQLRRIEITIQFNVAINTLKCCEQPVLNRNSMRLYPHWFQAYKINLHDYKYFVVYTK